MKMLTKNDYNIAVTFFYHDKKVEGRYITMDYYQKKAEEPQTGKVYFDEYDANIAIHVTLALNQIKPDPVFTVNDLKIYYQEETEPIFESKEHTLGYVPDIKGIHLG